VYRLDGRLVTVVGLGANGRAQRSLEDVIRAVLSGDAIDQPKREQAPVSSSTPGPGAGRWEAAARAAIAAAKAGDAATFSRWFHS